MAISKITQTLEGLPAYPDRSQDIIDGVYADKAEAWSIAVKDFSEDLVTFRSELNTSIGQMNDEIASIGETIDSLDEAVDAAAASATAASGYATTASSKATAAASSASAAATSEANAGTSATTAATKASAAATSASNAATSETNAASSETAAAGSALAADASADAAAASETSASDSADSAEASAVAAAASESKASDHLDDITTLVASVDSIATEVATVKGYRDEAEGFADDAEAAAASIVVGTAGVLDIDIDGTLAANSDALIPTQKAVKTYAQPLDADLTAIAALSTTSFGRSALTLADAAALRTLGGMGTAATAAIDTDSTFAADSDTRVPSQKAVKAALAAAVANLFQLAGSITNANTNPNYPAALTGDSYPVASNAGRVGGASGKQVEIGDLVVAIADNAGGTEASVGTSWIVLEHNLVGAVLSSSLGSNVATMLATFSSANIRAACTDETGSGGALVFATAPTLTSPRFTTDIRPSSNDGASLGISGTAFSDLFLASGAVIDFNAGNVVLTHSSGVLTVTTGDLRVTTAGTNAASVVTVGGTQTLTGKTMTAPILTDPAIRQTLNAQTGTTYTTVLSDEGKLVTLSNASAITCTIPPNGSVAYPVGTQITFAQIGAGQVTFAPGSGVTLNSTPGLKLRAQYSGATAIKTATNVWLILGDLAA